MAGRLARASGTQSHMGRPGWQMQSSERAGAAVRARAKGNGVVCISVGGRSCWLGPRRPDCRHRPRSPSRSARGRGHPCRPGCSGRSSRTTEAVRSMRFAQRPTPCLSSHRIPARGRAGLVAGVSSARSRGGRIEFRRPLGPPDALLRCQDVRARASRPPGPPEFPTANRPLRSRSFGIIGA